jgi:hypothetical protein
MKEIPNNAGGSLSPETGQGFSEARNGGLEARVFRTMILAVVFAVLASFPFAPWRVTAGLFVGGLLSLLNHYWLRNSTTAAFSVVVHGAKPKLKLAQYILRYLVIATVVFIGYKFNLVSLAATFAGLCSFVVALFAEACREFYFAIIHREEIN